MTQLFPSFFVISPNAVFIAVISAVFIEATSGTAPLLVMSSKTAEKPTFFPGFFDVWFCIVGNVVFSLLFQEHVLLHSSRLNCLLPMVDVVAYYSSQYLFALPCIFLLIFCNTLQLVWQLNVMIKKFI